MAKFNRGRTSAQRARYAAQVERNRAKYAAQQAEREATEAVRIAKYEEQERKRTAKAAREHERYLRRKAAQESQDAEIFRGADMLDSFVNSVERVIDRTMTASTAAYAAENIAIIKELFAHAVTKNAHKITYSRATPIEVGKWITWQKAQALGNDLLRQVEEWIGGVYSKKYSRASGGREHWEAFILRLRQVLDVEDWKYKYGVGTEINWNKPEDDPEFWDEMPEEIRAQLNGETWT